MQVGARTVAIWKESKGWKYEIFDLDVAPEVLPGFEELVRLWQNKRGDRSVPALGDFDVYDFKGWHGRISMLDVFHDPFDLRYRLFGETVAERYMTDFTGKLLSELVDNGREPPEDVEFYRMACREKRIVRVSGELYWLRRPHVKSTFVEFPLSDNGETTTHIVSAMI